jgi:hypothetical protein
LDSTTLIAVADSLSFRVADLNERGPRYKWRRLIENFFGKLTEFKRIALRRQNPRKLQRHRPSRRRTHQLAMNLNNP